MEIRYKEIHHDGEVEYYSLDDAVAFGKYGPERIHSAGKGRSLRYLIKSHPEYIDWMLNKQGGFGLTVHAMNYYL